jgi:hypothetical protein
MTPSEINDIATRWISESGKFGDPWLAIEKASELDNPKVAFSIVKRIHYLLTSQREINYGLMGLLAAGHLENLLCDFGESLIDEIEILASNDEEFSKLLCGVWQSEISDEIYARIEKCMHPTHEFD